MFSLELLKARAHTPRCNSRPNKMLMTRVVSGRNMRGRSPRSKGCLQHGAKSRNKENGGDELTFGHVVVLDAERLGQDERDGDDAPEGQDVMLGKHRHKHAAGALFSSQELFFFFYLDRFQLLWGGAKNAIGPQTRDPRDPAAVITGDLAHRIRSSEVACGLRF